MHRLLFVVAMFLLRSGSPLVTSSFPFGFTRGPISRAALLSTIPNGGGDGAKQKAGGKLQRLERIVANRGVGSRKEVSALFRQGRVRVGGKVVLSGADRYPLNTAVEIVGYGSVDRVPLLAAYHKPTGVVSTMRDDWGRVSLAELQLEYPFLKNMHPVGRLDADTSGLLLFSSDGVLTQSLLHPSSEIPRVYEALGECCFPYTHNITPTCPYINYIFNIQHSVYSSSMLTHSPNTPVPPTPSLSRWTRRRTSTRQSARCRC